MEPVDVSGGGVFGLGAGLPCGRPDQFRLDGLEERLQQMRRKSVAQDVQRGAFFTPAIFLAEVSDRCSCRAEIGLILGRPGKSLAVRTHLAPIAA